MDENTPNPATHSGLSDRQRSVYKMRVSGHKLREIARALGVSHETVREDFDAAQRYIARLENMDMIQERQMAVDRLDAMLAAVWPRAIAGHLYSVDRVIQLEDRRAKLLGLDAARKLEMTGKDGGSVDVRVEDLRQKYTPEEAAQKALEMSRSVALLTSAMTRHQQDGGERN